jgi:hypothetical protein
LYIKVFLEMRVILVFIIGQVLVKPLEEQTQEIYIEVFLLQRCILKRVLFVGTAPIVDHRGLTKTRTRGNAGACLFYRPPSVA